MEIRQVRDMEMRQVRDMEIRQVRIEDDDELHAFYEAMRAAEHADNPDRPIWPEEMLVAELREPTPDALCEAWAAFDDGVLLGGAMLFVPQLDNLDKVYTGIDVAPVHQRQGVGAQLLKQLVSRAVAHGRTTVLTESTIPFEGREGHGYRRFAERHGFSMASVEVSRRLALPVSDEQVQAWIDEAAPHHTDYRIATYIDGLPDELLPSFCDVVNQLAIDAPTGDIAFEAEAMTPEIRKQTEERNKRNGMFKAETVAIAPDGRVAALSAMGAPAQQPEKLLQWATIVAREHRGHRLGLATKAHNLRAVQREFPERREIFTQNNEDNSFMVGINEKMGFVPVELCVEFQRILDLADMESAGVPAVAAAAR